MKFGWTPEAEILNSRLAMLGFVIAVGTYAATGQLIPGIWQGIIPHYALKVKLDFTKYLCYNTGIW